MNVEQMIGLGLLVSVVTGLLKRLPGFPDGYGGLLAVTGNVVIYAVVAYGQELQWDLTSLDHVAGLLAQLFALGGPFLISLLSSLASHLAAKKMLPHGFDYLGLMGSSRR